jgi:hypothetical protein
MILFKKLLGTIILFCLLSFYFLPGNAYAYIDPGTGSYVIQIIIAAALGVLFTIKTFWSKIKSFFINYFSNKSSKNK